MDAMHEARIRYKNLPKRVIQLLNEQGIDDFPSLLSNLETLQKQLNRLKPSKTLDKLEHYLLFLSNAVQDAEIISKSDQHNESLINAGNDYSTQFLDLPIIYFYKSFSSRIIRILYEQDIYTLRDLYKKSENSHTMYLYWKKVLDTEAFIYFSRDQKERYIEFSKGVQKFLEFNNIIDITILKHDISSYDDFRKYAISNRDIYTEIREALLENSNEFKDIKDYINGNFCEKINLLLKRFKGVDRGVFHERYFENRTLEEIGQTLDLTRERVRQIESKSRFFIEPIFDFLLTSEIDKYPNFKRIIESRPLLYPEEKYLFHFLDDTESFIFNLLPLSFKISVIDTENNDYIISFRKTSQIKFEAINDYIKKYKIKNLKTNLDDEEITDLYYLLIAEGLVIQDDTEKSFVKEFIRSLLTKRFLMMSNDKKVYLRNTTISRVDLLENILKKYGPLHYTEVKKLLASEYDLNIKERNVHATLSREGFFINVGRGIYDTKSSKFSGKTIIQLVTDFLTEKSSPQSLKDIENYVLKRKKIKKSSIAGTLLCKPDIFGRTEDGQFGLKTWESFQYTRNPKRKTKYPVTARSAFNFLQKSGKLKDPFDIDEYMRLLKQVYKSETPTKWITLYTLLNNLEKDGILIKLNLNNKPNKWKIKN